MSGGPTCAVIGGGVIGAAAACALTRRGARVTLFEQFESGHDRGSSHGATRLFRTAYFEHPDYVPLLKRAASLWRALESDSRETLLEMTGVFMAGRADSMLVSGALRSAEQHGLAMRRLTRAEAKKRFFWFGLDNDMETLIEPDAGFIYADRAREAFLNGAKAFGAEIHHQTPIRGIHFGDARIDLVTVHGKLCFDRIIAAPGAFAPEMLGDVGARVTPMRKALFWTSPGEDRFSVANGFLPFAIEEADGRFYYGFPAVDGDGVKIGEHTGGAPVAAARNEAPEYAAQARSDLEAFLKRRAPGLSPAITKQQSCLYAMSPDGHFIIDRHRDDERMVFALGHSGHGFKFAPVIGEALADLALKGEMMREFDFLKTARFAV